MPGDRRDSLGDTALTSEFSKTQIDRLGDRLKRGPHAEDDLNMLDEYRRSFGEAYERVVQTISRQLRFSTTGRPAKSTVSIVEKPRRESIRLSQMQDIAGCRITVKNIAVQERAVASLSTAFPESHVIDRRDNPSLGYRAVHVIPKIDGKPIEIQIRTELQHLWAEFSEKSSDRFGSMIKYGGGPEAARQTLVTAAAAIAACESVEELFEAGLGSVKPSERDELMRGKIEIAVLLKAAIASLDDPNTKDQ